jgi:putative nucleotidyltransferase with HDIG domain
MSAPKPVLGTILLGLAVVGVSVWRVLDVSVGTLALFVAAAVLTELVEEADRQRSRDAVELDRFRLASAVQVGAVIVLGPWAGAVVAVAGVAAGALFRGGALQTVLFRGAAFVLAAVAGGGAFLAAGGHTGQLALLEDLLPLVVLGVVYLTVRALLLDVVVARESFDPRLASSGGEVALGAVIALLATTHPWNVVAVVPIALALHWTQLRTTRLQRETLRALETFANIVDERDPSTYRHSIRVAAYVDQLARALKLPFSDIDRLRWAGRLHDLGKVAVDSSVLRKAAPLDRSEWAAVRRHPRLSARLLRRFEFVARQARAVELHHERFDGLGYYGIESDDLPLAAHFLIVADSFDAMTTDRPYRPALTHAEALVEIERNAGTQFHPVVAKAFVAVQRGLMPEDVLAEWELTQVRTAATPHPLGTSTDRSFVKRPELLVLGGIVLALGGLGFGETRIAIAGAVIAATGAALRTIARVRSDRLSGSLRAALTASDRELVLMTLMARLSRLWPVDWAGLVAWDEDGLGGRFEESLGEGPAESAVTSWLVREAESDADLIVAPGHELGREGFVLALPLRRETSALAGFLVLAAASLPRRHVELALLECLDEIGLALAGREAVVPAAEQAVEPPVRAGGPVERAAERLSNEGPAAEPPVRVGGPVEGSNGNGSPSKTNGSAVVRNGTPANGSGAHQLAGHRTPEQQNGSTSTENGGNGRTSVGDELNDAAHRLIDCLTLSESGDLASTEEESDEALDDARAALARYRVAPSEERTEATDFLAEALDGFLRWPREHDDDRDDFGAVLHALVTAGTRYGAPRRPSNE